MLLGDFIICDGCGGYTPDPCQKGEEYLRKEFERSLILSQMKYGGSRSERLIAGVLLGWVRHCAKCQKEFAVIEIPYSVHVVAILGVMEKFPTKQRDRFMLPEWVTIVGYRGRPPLFYGWVNKGEEK